MKKLLLSLALMLAFGFTMSAKTLYTCLFGASYNQESVSSYASTWTVKVGDNTWVVDSCNNNKNGWDYVRCGRKGVASTGFVTTGFAVPEKIADVVVVVDKITAASVEAIKLETSAAADFKTVDAIVEIAKDDFKAGEMKFALATPKANMYYRVSFVCASASANGVVQFSEIRYNDDEADAPKDVEEVADIAAFKAKADKSNPVIIKNDVEVLCQVGTNLFIQDASGRILIYGKIDQEYKSGDVIPGGFQGVYSLYGGCPQITNVEGLKPATSNKPFTPRTVTLTSITEADVFDYVVIENLAIEAINNRNITFKQGETTFAGYNQFNAVVTLPTDYEGKTYTVKAVIGSYNGNVQIQPVEFEVNNESTGVEEVADIAAFKAKADNMSPVIIKNDVEVLCQIGYNLFIQDASGRILIYGKIDQEYKSGDVIPGGFQGVYSLYGGCPQITKVEGLKPATTNKPFTPRTVTLTSITEADVFDYVVIENLAIETVNNRNITFKQGETTFAGYNQFNTVVALPTDYEGKTYTVKAVIGSYNGNVQIQPVEFEESQSSAIEEIGAEDAPVEYFNIQGIRVANPEPGLYIRRQGNKVSKVIVR